jgi:hypothetical protein
VAGIAETAKLIASLELKDNFTPNANKAMASLGRLESTSFRVGQNIGKGINNAAKNIARIGLVAGGAAIAGLTASVRAASDLEQAVGAVDSVFGKSSKTIEAWGKTAAEAAGLSKREVNEMAAVTGAQLQGMGFEAEEAAKQAVILQKRAADLAATFGGPTADAMQAISSLMRGERDPIERYGVSIKAVDISARIAAKGLDTSTAAAKKQAEAIAGMELLMEQTAKTQGQFAREADGLAGSQARLRANLENTGAVIGRVLLPQLAKLTGRFNDLLVKNEPAIARFAEQLPAVFDKVLAAVERIPWESIGASLQLAGTGAKALLDVFLGMPPWVQTAVITGWGLNKLTGGALGGIVAELGKGLIKGVLGINAAVVNVNGPVAGGVPGAAGGLGSVLKGIFPAAVILGIGTAIGSVIVDALGGPLTGPEKDTGTGRVVGELGDIKIVLGQSYAAQVRAEDERKRHPQRVIDNSPEARQARSDQRQLVVNSFLSHQASERSDTRLAGMATTLTTLQAQSHADLQAAISVLQSSSDPTAIAAAAAAAVAAVRGGAGSAGTTGGVLGDLKTQLKAAEAANNPDLAAKIKAAIAQIEPFQKGRQWQKEQIDEARKIASGQTFLGDKVSRLQTIEQDLLSHNRTMAADIVSGLRDVVIAIDSMPLRFPGPISAEQGGGFVPRSERPGAGGGKSPTVNDQTGFVLTGTFGVSTRDINDKQTLRSRIGPTPTQAGSA